MASYGLKNIQRKVRELGLAPRRQFHRWLKVRDLGLAPRRRPKVLGLGLAPRRRPKVLGLGLALRRRPKVPSLGLAPCRQPPFCRPRSGRSNVERSATHQPLPCPNSFCVLSHMTHVTPSSAPKLGKWFFGPVEGYSCINLWLIWTRDCEPR